MTFYVKCQKSQVSPAESQTIGGGGSENGEISPFSDIFLSWVPKLAGLDRHFSQF